jgi:peptidylprolyl isomerase
MNRGLGLNILVVLFLAVALFTAGCINEDTSGVSEAGDYVEVDYTGTLTDGTLFDSSIGYEPLGFVLASESMISGFDAAAHGMTVGETKTVTIPSEDAYGAWSEDMILEIPRNIETEEEEPPVAGDYIYLFTGMGFAPAIVLEVTDELMIVDANHQLAGQDLVFEITMVKIVKPDDPEHPANAVESDDIPLQEFIIEVSEAEATE